VAIFDLNTAALPKRYLHIVNTQRLFGRSCFHTHLSLMTAARCIADAECRVWHVNPIVKCFSFKKIQKIHFWAKRSCGFFFFWEFPDQFGRNQHKYQLQTQELKVYRMFEHTMVSHSAGTKKDFQDILC